MSANTTTLTPKQREAIYEAWIAALRSGQYKQGQNYLELDGKFCCLGVLCHVLHQRPELGIEMDRFVAPDGTAAYSTITSPWHPARMPYSIAVELGLSTTMPSAAPRVVESALRDLNDINGASFAEIAQFIEDSVIPLLRTKGILPPAQKPTEGEEIMVNTPHGVFTLPLHPSGLSSGPRFVVHVPELQRDSVTVRYDLSPAQTESAIRDALIRMGWTPPEGEPVEGERK